MGETQPFHVPGTLYTVQRARPNTAYSEGTRVQCGLKKTLNVSRPSEQKMSKRLSGIIGCNDKKTSLWHLIGFAMVVTLGPGYHVGEKPTVKLHAYINRHAGTPNKTKTNHTTRLEGTKEYQLHTPRSCTV